MKSLAEFGRRVRFWLHRSEANRELEEEMQFHLQMKAERYRENGVSEHDAPFAAQRKFGNPLLLKELSTQAWGWHWLESLTQDVHYALRALRNNKGFTAIALLTLTLGAGVNAVMFSFVDGLWMRPLPVRDSGGLIRLYETAQNGPGGSISYPNYLDYRAQMRSMTGMVTESRRGPLLNGNGWTLATTTRIVSPNYFEALGVNAAAGRIFRERDSAAMTGPVLMLSYNLWQKRYRGDPAIVGKSVYLNKKCTFTVVGVAAKGFHGVDLGDDPDLWIPIASWSVYWSNDASDRRYADYWTLGRLRPGASIKQARAEASLVAQRLAASYPDSNGGHQAVLETDFDHRVASGGYQPFVLLGIVILVQLIACANVANLLLARGEARRRELGMRMALGCGRWRLFRQMLTESAVLGVAGTCGGLLLAAASVRLLPAVLAAIDASAQNEFAMDGRVLAFTLSVSLLTVLLFGLIPALRASRKDLFLAAKRDGAEHHKGILHGLGGLVAAQIALTLVLLTSAGLLMRTLVAMMRADLGFQCKNVLLLELAVPFEHNQAVPYYGELVNRLQETPGVRRACVTNRPPMASYSGGYSNQVDIPGYVLPAGAPKLEIKQTMVGAGYFEISGIQLLRGRFFDAHDTAQSRRVAIINQTMEDRYFSRTSAAGRVIRIGVGDKAKDYEIVGVVRDNRLSSIDEKPQPYLFLDYAQEGWASATIMVETANDPWQYANTVKRMVRAINPGVEVYNTSTLEDEVKGLFQLPRVIVISVGLLAALGLSLAAIGLYGVLSYAGARRKREIGIRIALGGRYGATIWLMLRQGLALTAIGCVVGLAAAFAVTRLLASFLYGVSPRDPATFAGVVAVTLAVSLLASYLPARRAVRIDPVTALRED
jgi:putative ABC transport system permease protein